MTTGDLRLAPGLAVGARAALVLWLPVLLPLVTGMLHEEAHVASTYLLSAPLVPGILVPVLLQLDGAWFFVVGGLVTALLFAALCWGLARLPRPWALALQVAIVLLVAFEAVGYANALRA